MTTPAPAEHARHEDKGAKKQSFWTLKRAPKADEDKVDHPEFTPTLPHVNLLPPVVRDAIRAGKLRRWFILGGLLMAAVVAGVWYLQSGQISTAQDELAQAQLANARIKAGQGALEPVKGMYNEITRLQGLVDTTLASQPEAALVVRQLQSAADKVGGITFDTAEVTYTGVPKAGSALNACPNPDPFTSKITIGCLSFGATAKNRDQVSALLRALGADSLFVGPYVTSSTVGDNGKATVVTFSGSAGVSLDALKTKLTDEQIAAILAPPEPVASASPTAGGGA